MAVPGGQRLPTLSSGTTGGRELTERKPDPTQRLTKQRGSGKEEEGERSGRREKRTRKADAEDEKRDRAGKTEHLRARAPSRQHRWLERYALLHARPSMAMSSCIFLHGFEMPPSFFLRAQVLLQLSADGSAAPKYGVVMPIFPATLAQVRSQG